MEGGGHQQEGRSPIGLPNSMNFNIEPSRENHDNKPVYKRIDNDLVVTLPGRVPGEPLKKATHFPLSYKYEYEMLAANDEAKHIIIKGLQDNHLHKQMVFPL